MTLLSYLTLIPKARALFISSVQCKSCLSLIRNQTSSSITTRPLHEVNTNVAKDVILFKYENPKYFRYMNIFAVVQYVFWSYLGVFAFSTLRDSPIDKSKVDESTAWYMKINLGENKYKNTLSALAIVIGTGSLCMIWMFTLKSVRYLILNKGGKDVTFVTYTPFGNNRIMKVPLKYVCAKEKRLNATAQLPLKVHNKWMHFILDMNGEFKNPILFDSTAGLFRKVK